MSNTTQNKIQYEDYACAFLDKYQYFVSGGVWFVWNGKHWIREDNPKLQLRKWMLQQNISQTDSIVKNTIGIIEALAATNHDVPSWRDGTRQPLVAFKNGLLDIASRKFMEPTTDYLTMWNVPCEWSEKAECPIWLKFIGECLNGDEQQVRLLQEWCGYLLSGDTSRQKYLCHIGAGGCGKSTIAGLLRWLFGGCAFDLRQLTNRFGCGFLVGQPLAIVGEVELAGCREKAAIMEKMKAITGNDSVSYERKGDPVGYSAVLPTRLHIVSNTMPALRDPSLALCRRMLILKSDQQALAADQRLTERLKDEAAGIVRWALDGYTRLTEQDKFTTTDRSKAEIDHLKREASFAASFLEDCCTIHEKLAQGCQIPNLKVHNGEPDFSLKQGLWDEAFAYADHVNIRGDELNPSWFWRDLRAVLPALPPRHQRWMNGKPVDIIQGVKVHTSFKKK